MKVFILTDLEGVSGVNGRAAGGVGNKIINEEVSHRLLTEEVNATPRGLVKAGATEILCWDGHGGSNSINIEDLHPEVQLYQSGGAMNPARLCDSSGDAFVELGQHAMIGVPDGFLNHTFNSHAVVNMWLNGEAIGEIGVQARLAAAVGVPTILVSGDAAACREAQALLGAVACVATKTGINRYSVINRHPVKVRADLEAAAERALKRKDEFPVLKTASPCELKMALMCPNMADAYEKAGARRIDHVTVALSGDNFTEVWSRRIGYAPGVHERKFGTP